jgi:prepilin-type N-terminal cleavage/methylation domain-containing protein
MNRATAGMTLVEVLMALAILGVAAGVLMTATTRCLAVLRVSKNYYEARRLLEVAEVDYPLLVIKAGQREDVKEDKAINLNVGPIGSPSGFTYERTSTRSEDKEELMEVRDRVTWSSRGKTGFEEVTSYLYYTNEITL